MNGDDDYSKADLEKMIHENGGVNVQYPTPLTNYVIASRKGKISQNFPSSWNFPAIKVQNLIQTELQDVINYRWLLDCIEQNCVLPLEPKYMMFTTSETKRKFLMEIDKFGDSYTKDATVKSLREVEKNFGI
jgi:DNA ligase-4